jgi:hypothetical protein
MISKSILLFIFCTSTVVSNSQIKDSAFKFQTKTIDGYFILVRDSIQKVDRDVTPNLMNFTTYFLTDINSENFECLKSFNQPSTDSLVFVSGGISYDIKNSSEHKAYINWLIEKKYFEKAAKGIVLYDGSRIPKYLINSKSRFVSVYQGCFKVIGPFFPFNKVLLHNQKLYMALPIESNQSKYLYSIVF